MTNKRFPRSKRLLKKQQFRDVLSHGKKHVAECFVFYIKKNDQNTAKLGIIVAKRFVKLAVKRNTIKRIIRESFRQSDNMPSLNLDIVIVCRSNLSKLNKSQLRAELNQRWEKLATIYA